MQTDKSVERANRGLGLTWKRVSGPSDVAAIRERARREYEKNEVAGRRRLDFSQRRDALYRRPLALSDVLAYLIAMWLGTSVIGGVALTPWVFAGIPVTLVFAKLFNLYDRDENRLHRATLDDVPGLFQLATMITLVAVLAQNLIADAAFSEVDILVTWLSLVALLVLGRTAVRALLNTLAQPERCVLIGDPRTTADVARKIRLQGLNVEIAATISADAVPSALGIGDLDAGEAFIRTVAPVVDHERANRVILASSSWPAEHLLHAVAGLMASGIKVSVLPSTARLASLSYEVDQLPGMALLGMKRFGISRSSQLVKRSFDLVVSASALIVLSPLMIAIAIAIKLDTPGTALYRTRRIGRGGREFEMLKFRSMVSGAHRRRDELRHLNQADGLFKIPEDPRVTRVGRVIRAALARRVAAAHQRAPRPDEPGRPTTAAPGRGRADRGWLPPPPQRLTGDHRPVADPRLVADAGRRHGRARLPVHGALVAVDGPEAACPNDPLRRRRPGNLTAP